MTYIGGTQSPHLRGFLRACFLRQQTTGSIRYDVHDVDAAGVYSPRPELEIRSTFPMEGWFPMYFELAPIPGGRHRLVLRHPKPLTIAGVTLDLCNLNELLLEELSRATDIASRVHDLSAHDRQLSQERGRSLIQHLRSYAQRLPDAPWSAWVTELGRYILGPRLNGIQLGMTSEFWSPKAPVERFSVLDRFLSDRRALNTYFTARGLNRSLVYPLNFPYMVVHRTDGCIVREPLLQAEDQLMLGSADSGFRLGSPHNATELFTRLSQAGIKTVAVIPKALPLILQMRMLGVDFAGQMDYLPQVKRLADMLDVPQTEILAIRFDLQAALSKSNWRMCLRAMDRYHWHGSRNRGKDVEVLRRKPSLLWLWLTGGPDWLDAHLSTGKIIQLAPTREVNQCPV